MIDKNDVVVYHWFGYDSDAPPYANLRAPVIPSIATLRAISDVTIYVIDISIQANDWAEFEKKLNFRVLRPRPHLLQYNTFAGWTHLSRLFDLRRCINTQDGRVIYSDSDVFWLKEPSLSGPADKFCFDGFNTGFFYYGDQQIEKFFEVFEAYTISALNSPRLRKVLMKHVGYTPWHYVWDEMITTYMAVENSELIHKIPNTEHGSPRRFNLTRIEEMENLHLNGVYVRNPMSMKKEEREHCRGLAGIMFSEFYELIKSSLGNDIEKVYNNQELQFGLKNQFSLLKQPNRLLSTIRDDGHYELGAKEKIMLI